LEVPEPLDREGEMHPALAQAVERKLDGRREKLCRLIDHHIERPVVAGPLIAAEASEDHLG
jgi:hypothetical protein